MPGQQGVEIWPAGARNLSALAAEDALPFANAFFDRILLVHAIEESPDPVALLREVWRVLSPSGRVVGGGGGPKRPRANSEKTPFGHWTPPTAAASSRGTAGERPSWSPRLDARASMCAGLVDAGWAEGFEQAGSRLMDPGFSGAPHDGGGETDLRR
jgi:SAM-dependent methyltransferase